MKEVTSSMPSISVSYDEGIATVRLSRPPLNIINLEAIRELRGAVRESAERTDTKVLVLRSGLSDVFSAGADIKEHLPERADELIHEFEELTTALTKYEKPTVAVVEGRCLGGGMELALACDFVFAEESAVFGQPEVNVGVFPPAASVLYPRLAGLRNAYRIILTGQNLSAREALSMGLISEVASADALEHVVKEFLRTLTEKSSAVLVLAKRAINQSLSLPMAKALQNSSRLYTSDLMKTKDAVEGLNAFMEKRKPRWQNA